MKEKDADILHSPKAKRIKSKCGKCSLGVGRPRLVWRALQRVGGVDGGPINGWSGRFAPLSSPSAVRDDRPSRDELLCRLSMLLSRGSTEVLGGLVGVTDGQADGSDVLYGLIVAEKGIHIHTKSLYANVVRYL